jgi:DNA-directed RNA polymerase specialized sigma24 family protein
MLIDRRIADQRRRHFAQKRGHGLVVGESVLFDNSNDSSVQGGIAAHAGRTPTPEDVLAVKDELSHRLQQLDDSELQQIAVWSMQGWTNDEIARQLGCATRTVERRLVMIRKIWMEAEGRTTSA